ncbi:MAG TPA: hypothetical protein PLC12_04705, partial [Candidatus Methanofastidiosa archaeon]|nr:hypothetical protein [Candidatus Methanofastidiosa archaeon]
MRKSFLVLSMLVLSLFSVLPLSVSADIAVTPADSIQDAIDAIEDGGTIYIGAGTYHVNLVINNPGKSFSMVAADGPGTVVLDGSASGSVIFVQDTNGHTITLDGLTITNGSAHGGGGMYDRYSTVIVTNCTFHDNEAYSYYGGGVFNYYSDASFTNCTFHNNYTYSDGGGMDSDYGVVTVTNCAFYENYAENAGGGTYNYLVDITYAGCTFYGNEAYYDGGGMYNDESSPTIMD